MTHNGQPGVATDHGRAKIIPSASFSANDVAFAVTSAINSLTDPDPDPTTPDPARYNVQAVAEGNLVRLVGDKFTTIGPDLASLRVSILEKGITAA